MFFLSVIDRIQYMDQQRPTADQLRVRANHMIIINHRRRRYVDGIPDPARTGCGVMDDLGYKEKDFICPQEKDSDFACKQCVIGATVFDNANSKHIIEIPLSIYTAAQMEGLRPKVAKALKMSKRGNARRSFFHPQSR